MASARDPALSAPPDSFADTGAQHDGDFRGEPLACYAICSVARSGSTLLSSMLWDTGLAGKPLEYFNPIHAEPLIQRWRSWGVGSRLPHRYWDRVPRSRNLLTDFVVRRYARDLMRFRSTPNGRFGFKLHYHQYERQLGLRPLEELFPNLRYLCITREDRVDQAISWWRAWQTGQWAAGDPAQREPVYSFGDILNIHAKIIREEQAWDEYFERRNISPLRTTYEQVIADPRGNVAAALALLGVNDDVAPTKPRMKRQADPLNRDWKERYVAKLAECGLLVSLPTKSVA